MGAPVRIWRCALLDMTMVDDGPKKARLQFDLDRARRSVFGEPSAITLHGPAHSERSRVEAFLEAAYARAFEGRIRSHYPTLMSVQDDQGRIHAAAGFRLASEGPLFLEQYLDEPVEDALERRLGVRTARDAIAEIGNLASDSPGVSLALFLALASHLDRDGCTHAVATATRQLRRRFARVGFATQTITRAEPVRLAGQAADWGAYYSRDPEVLAGAIAPALPALARLHPALPGGLAQ